MIFIFFNKALLRGLAALCGVAVAVAAYPYLSLSFAKLGRQGVMDALAIISFLIAGWLMMLVAEVVDNHYARAFACLCVGLGGIVSYKYLFRLDGPSLAALEGGAEGMQLVRYGFMGAMIVAGLLLGILIVRLALDKAQMGRRPQALAARAVNAEISAAQQAETLQARQTQAELDALPPIPLDSSPLAVLGGAGETSPGAASIPVRSPAPVSLLTGIGGMYLGAQFTLKPGSNSIGRQNADIELANDTQVSRAHAVIVVGDDGLASLNDAGSTNGTFLNDKRIDSAQLAPADVIKVGTNLFKVEA